LKTWQKRLKSKADKRSFFLEDKVHELHKEEAESNSLLIDYYAKINQLKSLKQSIREVQAKSEEMKAEQMREEQLLSEKEVEFFVVDRLGMLLLL